MHPYAIDSNERILIPLYLAILSVLLALFFQWAFELFNLTLPWWVEAPSVFALYGLFYKLFDKYLWKWEIFKTIGAIKTPNLNGGWKGHLASSYEDFKKKHDANIRIVQSWTRISIVLTTESSSSRSLLAGIITENPEQNTLSYQYLNEPRQNSEKSLHVHRGTATLNIQSDLSKFMGEYYSGRDRMNSGELVFEREK